MASLHGIPLAGLFVVCIFASSSSIHGVGTAKVISFRFPPDTSINHSADASFYKDRIELTGNHYDGELKWGHGWATYKNLVRLWDNSSKDLANFSTHFQFSIPNISDIERGGDGLTFFLAPSKLHKSNKSSGEWLGLFTNATDGNASNRIVAAEFDTFQNHPYDPDDNHVGIDVNSRKSVKTVPVNSFYKNMSLKNGKKWDKWVDYDGTGKKLKVFLLSNPDGKSASKPRNPILSYSIDLREFLPQDVKVGISASTGNSTETHTVYSWNFSCQYSGNTKRKSLHGNIVLASSLACFFVISCFIFWTKENKRGDVGESDEEFINSVSETAQSAREFSYAELSAATNSFNEEQKIGVGGFGCVYKGCLPSTNEVVAIKRISPSSKQGKREYKTEISINSKLTHHNLVKFLGWCHRKGDLILVYELLQNGSLDKYIFENPEASLDWEGRYNVACDVASALVYLHQDGHESVVHRDIKESNVMLDLNFKAKLGDFGLARVVERGREWHTTIAAGTLGYIAPEFLRTGQATREMDLFSFGALYLEIACGRRPIDWSLTDHNSRVVEWVWDLYGKNILLDAADEKLGGNFNGEEMERLMKVGLLCYHPDPTARPSIETVLDILKRGSDLPIVSLTFPASSYCDRVHLDSQSSSC